MTTDVRLNGEGLIFQPTCVNFKGFIHPPFGNIFDGYDMVDGYLDYIESSNMLLVVLIGGTYSSRVNCTRVIAVGQH